MKTINDLVGSYIICYNQKDWDKLILILCVYFPYMFKDSHYYKWRSDSTYQYVNIPDNRGIGWDTSEANNIDTYTKGLKRILIEDFLKDF